MAQISNQAVATGQFRAAQPTIEQTQVKLCGDHLLADRCADKVGATDKQYFHGWLVGQFTEAANLAVIASVRIAKMDMMTSLENEGRTLSDISVPKSESV